MIGDWHIRMALDRLASPIRYPTRCSTLDPIQAVTRKVRILSLDYDPVYGHDATRAGFPGDLSVFDYDVTIWDPAASFKTYMRSHESFYRGLPALSEHASVRIIADASRRRAEFSEFMAMGRVLIVMVTPPQQCYVDTGKREFSGTGRNQKTTSLVKEFDLLSAIPGEDCELIKSGGKRVTIEGDGPLPKLLRDYKNFIRYTAVISKPSGNVIARVAGTDRAISSVERSSTGGYLVFLPTFDFVAVPDDSDTDKDEDGDELSVWDEKEDEEENWLPEAQSFQYDLESAIEQLAGIEERSWPTWADRYLTSAQHQLRLEVTKQQKRIESARAKYLQKNNVYF